MGGVVTMRVLLILVYLVFSSKHLCQLSRLTYASN